MKICLFSPTSHQPFVRLQNNCWIETFGYFLFSHSQSWGLEENSEIHCETKASLLLLQSWVALSLKRGSPYLIIQSGLVTNPTRWPLIDPNSKKETGCNNALGVHSLCFFTGLNIWYIFQHLLPNDVHARGWISRLLVPWSAALHNSETKHRENWKQTAFSSFCRNISKRNVTPTAQHDIHIWKPGNFGKSKPELHE